jgi:cell wall-associated NlpC family hydrolase
MAEPAINAPRIPVKAVGEGAVRATNPFTPVGALQTVDEETFGSLWLGRQSNAQTTGGPPVAGEVDAAGADLSNGVVATAMKYIGTPYQWGGTQPGGFDCSGFTQYVLKQFGIQIPRVSYQQGTGGMAVAGDQLKPGDLNFSDNSNRNKCADHVALYIGGGKYIEAPKPGGVVQVRTLGGSGWWARRYNPIQNPGNPRTTRAV